MAGASPQQQQGQKLFNEIGATNFQAPNLFSNYNMPFSPSQQIGALNDYTTQGTQAINQQTATQANTAGNAAAANAASQGISGSIGTDLATGAREQAGAQGTNALQELQAQRLSLLPSIMSNANTQQLQVTQGAQNADFQNIQNLFNQFGGQEKLLGSFSNSNGLGDVLSVLNTLGNLGADAGKMFTGGL
jgi:hypothetical protein